MKFCPHVKEIMFTLLFIAGEKKFRFGGDPKKTDIFDEINASADVSIHVISFRVVFTWHFIVWNEISFLSKWP